MGLLATASPPGLRVQAKPTGLVCVAFKITTDEVPVEPARSEAVRKARVK